MFHMNMSENNIEWCTSVISEAPLLQRRPIRKNVEIKVIQFSYCTMSTGVPFAPEQSDSHSRIVEMKLVELAAKQNVLEDVTLCVVAN